MKKESVINHIRKLLKDEVSLSIKLNAMEIILTGFSEKERVLGVTKDKNSLLESWIEKKIPAALRGESIDPEYWQIVRFLSRHGCRMSKIFFEKNIEPIIKVAAKDEAHIYLSEKDLVMNSILSLEDNCIKGESFIDLIVNTPNNPYGMTLIQDFYKEKENIFKKMQSSDNLNIVAFEKLLKKQKDISDPMCEGMLEKLMMFFPNPLEKKEEEMFLEFISIALKRKIISFSSAIKSFSPASRINLLNSLDDFFERMPDIVKISDIFFCEMIVGIKKTDPAFSCASCKEGIKAIDNIIANNALSLNSSNTAPSSRSWESWDKIKIQLEYEMLNIEAPVGEEFNL